MCPVVEGLLPCLRAGWNRCRGCKKFKNVAATMIANSGWRHFIDHLWPAAIVSHKRAKVHRNVLKPRDVFESLHPGSIPAGLQPNAGNEFRKVVRGHAFAIVVCEHPVENRRGAVVADPLDTQANRNCKAGVDLSPIPIRSRPCQLVDTFSVLPIPFPEVEIQVEGVGLPRGDAELGFYNGTLAAHLEWHIYMRR